MTTHNTLVKAARALHNAENKASEITSNRVATLCAAALADKVDASIAGALDADFAKLGLPDLSKGGKDAGNPKFANLTDNDRKVIANRRREIMYCATPAAYEHWDDVEAVLAKKYDGADADARKLLKPRNNARNGIVKSLAKGEYVWPTKVSRENCIAKHTTKTIADVNEDTVVLAIAEKMIRDTNTLRGIKGIKSDVIKAAAATLAVPVAALMREHKLLSMTDDEKDATALAKATELAGGNEPTPAQIAFVRSTL